MEHTLIVIARAHVSRLLRQGRLGTARNRQAAVSSFLQFRGGLDVALADMDAAMMEDYEAWLRQQRGVCRNTSSFYMRGLRSVTGRAEAFRTVYTGMDVTRKRALTMAQMRRLAALDLTARPPLALARDLFMFSFCTRGMAFVDMAYLRREDVAGGELRYRRRKTGQRVCLRWESEMQRVADRWPAAGQYLLPIIRRADGTEWQQYRNALILTNRRLKEVGRMAGLSHPLSMYCARHSWATAARDSSVPLCVISRGLGHDSDRHTQIYLSSIDTGEVDRANRQLLDALL